MENQPTENIDIPPQAPPDLPSAPLQPLSEAVERLPSAPLRSPSPEEVEAAWLWVLERQWQQLPEQVSHGPVRVVPVRVPYAVVPERLPSAPRAEAVNWLPAMAPLLPVPEWEPVPLMERLLAAPMRPSARMQLLTELVERLPSAPRAEAVNWLPAMTPLRVPEREPLPVPLMERLPSAPTLRGVAAEMGVGMLRLEPMQAPVVDWVPLTPPGTLPLHAIVVQQSAAIRISNFCKPFFERVGIAITTAVAGFGHLWDGYYQGMALGEENVRSSLEFTVSSLFAMVQLKGLGIPGFPFQTHPQTIIFTTTGIIVYCLASVAEFVISAAGVDRASAYAIIAHLVRMGSFSILVGSLASLLLHNQ